MRKFTWLLAIAMPLAFVSCKKDAVQKELANPEPTRQTQSVSTGNGSLSGSHYTLNILGSKDPKNLNMTGGSGHRIFVALGNKTGLPARTKIMLTPAPVGQSFLVLDANGTDGVASFQLPSDVSTTYRVFARALGGPGGSAVITTCADADLTDEGYLEVCSTVSTPALTSGPKPKFTEVSTELLTITIGADVVRPDGTILEAGTYNLFDPAMEDYFWAYDNNGLKLLQLRFYPIN